MKRFFGHQTLNDEDARIGDLQSDDSEGSEDIDKVQQIPSSSPISSIGSIHSSIEASLSSQETTFPAKRLHDTKQIRSKHDSSSHSSSTTSKKWYADSDDEKEDESQSSSSCEPKAAFETSDSNRTMYASRAKKQERKMSNDENITRAAIVLRSVTRETKTTAHARRILSKTNDILLQEKETVGDIYDDKSSLQRKDTPAFRKHVDTEIPITKSRDVARHVVDTWQNSNLKSIGKMNSVNSPKAIFGSFRGITSQNKTLGAFAGKSENGVVLEGWLRQKQRRGVKGLKKWNSRYYVVYAETNEIRYYADLVASAWGSIPLNEIGSISARLIQNVEKLSHPKYKGCRFDIKCRNSWGTHYADDYVSHDSSSSLPGIRPYENGDSIGDSTKSSTRVYSLIADSPQTASLWVSMIASLILRNPGSPKGEVRDHISNRVGDKSAPDDTVPWLVKCAVDYIYKSTPGIETPLFYEENADTDKLEICMNLLQVPNEEKPGNIEIDKLLNVVTAGAIVKMWLEKMEQPIVPFALYPEFEMIAIEAKENPADAIGSLKTLREKLPAKNRASLICLLFHLNDISAYASKNKMDASYLAKLFSKFIVRPQKPTQSDNTEAIHWLLSDIITQIDDYIDEKETG